MKQSKGLGLLGIEERVARLGGGCNMQSAREAEPSWPLNSRSRPRPQIGAHNRVKQIRILLADDHNVMRRGLRLLLERQPGFAVVAEAADGRQAVDQTEAEKPDVVVLDIAMPNLSGIEAAQRISAILPQTAIVILSMHADESYILGAPKAGVKEYLLKDSAETDLIDAIRAVHEGKAFF